MEKISQIDRSNSMGNDYNVTDPVKSGFNLTYNSHPAGLVLGRLYPNAYQHIMPGDKFSGRNEFNLIAEQLATPVVSDVNVSQHNFFVTYRSIDKGFEDLLTPTKLNGMSASLSTPTFSLYKVASVILDEFSAYLPEFTRVSASSDWAFNSAPDVTMFSRGNLKSSLSSLLSAAQGYYCDDAFEDLFDQCAYWLDLINSSAMVTLDMYKGLWYCIFDFFCGEGSMMDYLGYPILKHNDVSTLMDYWVRAGKFTLWKGSSLTGDQPLATLAGDIIVSPAIWQDALLAPIVSSQSDSVYSVDKREVSEYAIRAMYAIWFEYYRVNELEPRSSNLPEYRQFGQ